MSEPTTGIGRITIPYTVSGMDHDCRMYVANPTLSGAVWRIDANPSVGGTVDWADAAQSFSASISYILATGTTVGAALLEEYSATGWLPRDTATVTMPNLTGSAKLASQCTLTLRVSDFSRPKIVVMEINDQPPLSIDSPTGGGAVMDSFIAEFLSTGALAARPYHVMTNMHEFFLLEDPFVSASLTYNKKLRRARGL